MVPSPIVCTALRLGFRWVVDMYRVHAAPARRLGRGWHSQVVRAALPVFIPAASFENILRGGWRVPLYRVAIKWFNFYFPSVLNRVRDRPVVRATTSSRRRRRRYTRTHTVTGEVVRSDFPGATRTRAGLLPRPRNSKRFRNPCRDPRADG